MNQHTILFVDDEENILNSLKRVFRKEGHNVLMAKSAKEGMDLFQLKQPSIVVSDQQMPEITGVEFLKFVRDRNSETIRILLTGHSDIKATIQAINEGGIYRYISKPWDDNEIRFVIRQAVNHLDMKAENKKLTELTKSQNKELKSLNLHLEQKVSDRTKDISEKNDQLKRLYEELESNFDDFIRAFVGILEIYNPLLGNHSKRVAAISRLIALKLKLEQETIQNIEMAAMLHDIGMIGMPGFILDTPLGDLKNAEREIFFQHPIIGEATLSSMKKFEKASTIIRSHHENYNGSGFPDHLKEDQIPIESRVISVVDAYDEVKKLGIFKVKHKFQDPNYFITNNSGKRFDPAIVDAFFEVLKELKIKASREKEISFSMLREGMVISRDVVTTSGVFLVAKDTILKEAHTEKIKAYKKLSPLKEKIYVYSEE